MTEKLTQDQLIAKAKELTQKYNCEVKFHSIIDSGGNQVVGYFQQPCTEVILFASDKLTVTGSGGFSANMSDAGPTVFRDTFLKDESDSRISSEERKDAKVRASFIIASINIAQPYVNEFKAELKKN